MPWLIVMARTVHAMELAYGAVPTCNTSRSIGVSRV
jgi:hypothetical protein